MTWTDQFDRLRALRTELRTARFDGDEARIDEVSARIDVVLDELNRTRA